MRKTAAYYFEFHFFTTTHCTVKLHVYCFSFKQIADASLNVF